MYYRQTRENNIHRDAEIQRRAMIEQDDEEAIMEEEEEEKAAVQAKLEINSPDDEHEKHADEVAKKVSNDEDASELVKNPPVLNFSVQNKTEENGTLMKKSDGGNLQGTDQLQTNLDSTKGGGQSLDDNTKTSMEQNMGVDLSSVKIHTDSKANEMSEGINAKAFTHGSDIYFKSGNYNPGTSEGKNLLGHELAHTQQQKDGVNRKIFRAELKEASDPYEQEGFIYQNEVKVAVLLNDTLLYMAPSIEKTDDAIQLKKNDWVAIKWLGTSWAYVNVYNSEPRGQEGYVPRTSYLINEKKLEPNQEPKTLNKEWRLTLTAEEYIPPHDPSRNAMTQYLKTFYSLTPEETGGTAILVSEAKARAAASKMSWENFNFSVGEGTKFYVHTDPEKYLMNLKNLYDSRVHAKRNTEWHTGRHIESSQTLKKINVVSAMLDNMTDVEYEYFLRWMYRFVDSKKRINGTGEGPDRGFNFERPKNENQDLKGTSNTSNDKTTDKTTKESDPFDKIKPEENRVDTFYMNPDIDTNQMVKGAQVFDMSIGDSEDLNKTYSYYYADLFFHTDPPVMNGADQSLPPLDRAIKLLKEFQNNKTELLMQSDLLKPYLETPDQQKNEVLKNTSTSLFTIDPALLQRFMDMTGINWGKILKRAFISSVLGPTAGPIFNLLFSDYADKKEMAEIEAELNKKGSSVMQLFQYLAIFQEKVLAKSMALLEENKKDIDEAMLQYKADIPPGSIYSDSLNELVTIITGKKPTFDKADKLRAKEIIKIFTKYPNSKLFVGQLIDSSSMIKFAKEQLKTPVDKEFEDRAEKFMHFARYDAEWIADKLRSMKNPDLRDVMALYLAARQAKLSEIARNNKEESTSKEMFEPFLSNPIGYINTTFPGMAEAAKLDKTANDDMKSEKNVKAHKILMDVSINFRELSGIDEGTEKETWDEIRFRIKKEIREKKKNNKEARELIASEPERAWELDQAILLTENANGISQNDPGGKLIADRVSDTASVRLLRDIALGAMGIVLGIAGFFTGGATWAGAAIAFAGLAISLVDVYFQVKDYTFQKSVSNASIDQSKELSGNDPSLLSVVLSIAGAIFDGFAFLKALKTIGKTTEITKSLNAMKAARAGKEAEEFAIEARKIFEILKANGAKFNGIADAADFEKMMNTAFAKAENIQGNKGFLQALTDAKIIGIAAKEGLETLPEVTKLGLHEFFVKDAEAARALMSALANDPARLMRYSIEILASPKQAQALADLSKLFKGAESEQKLARILGSMGGDESRIAQLADTMDTIMAGAIKNDLALTEEIMLSPNLQRALFDNAKDPDMLKRLWDDFNTGLTKSGKEIKSESFVDYVSRRKVITNVENTTSNQTIVEKLGKTFSSLKEPFEKNLALLRYTEKGLASEIEKVLNGTSNLSKKMQDALKEIINKDDLFKGTMYDAAHANVIRKVNDTIKDNLDTFADYKILMGITEQNRSLGGLAEALVENIKKFPGEIVSDNLAIELSNVPVFPGRTRIILDKFFKKAGKNTIGEVKVGTSFDPEQLDNYYKLIQNQDNLASRFKGTALEGNHIDGVTYKLLPGAEDFTLAATKGAQQGFVDPVVKRVENLWVKMEGKGMEGISEIYYFDTSGRLWLRNINGLKDLGLVP